MTGCITAEEARRVEQQRIELAAREKALAEAQSQMGELVDQAISLSDYRPQTPRECREEIQSGVVIGDRLDVALLKTNEALKDANASKIACTEYFQRAWNKKIAVKSIE